MADGAPDTQWNGRGEERDGEKDKPSTCPQVELARPAGDLLTTHPIIERPPQAPSVQQTFIHYLQCTRPGATAKMNKNFCV